MTEHQTSMTPEMEQRLGQYLRDRDNERLQAAAKMWGNLTEREQLLVKEAAVMGFVQGNLARPDSREEHSGDRDVVIRVLTAVRDFTDLYPTLAALEED